ncbi:hypothetical protein [Peloplasma aerotolerans]|uniref:YitT family protein n=1 Tax=Peloplasma aerotolerans TaxID=3044389 RepID=A0AAW6U7K6_9MOLU|nr:hypothetical protein [Mariniplasma sp. M4Ah]MDI6452066.1 hypothetical protein [Mariniplasma sp. M4Ah]MDR4968122.1 hypothetical protein [Acholeplasmataceae bacterium]
MIKKIMIHLSGFMFIALGIVGVIFSRVGATPLDAFNYFVYTLTPLTLGTIAVISGLVVSTIAYLLDPKKDMLISIGFLFLVGLFIDGWKFLFEIIFPLGIDSFFIRIPLAGFSLISITFGAALTLTTGLASSPFERLLIIINRKVNNLMLSKIMMEGTFLILAVIMGLITGLLFEQVHVYTLILVLGIGPFISMFVDLINKQKRKGVEVHGIK